MLSWEAFYRDHTARGNTASVTDTLTQTSIVLMTPRLQQEERDEEIDGDWEREQVIIYIEMNY